MKNEFKFKQQNVSLFRIYCHLFEPIDWLFLFLGICGSIGAGIAQPLMYYIMNTVMSDVGDTSENRDTSTNIASMEATVTESMNSQMKQQLLYGGLSFICYFLSIYFWALISSRCIYKLKKQYFILILHQKQSWFDSNNIFEFPKKMQNQLEQIEQGIGNKTGYLLSMLSQFIVGLIFAFICCWKLTLLMLCVAPFLIFSIILSNTFLKNGMISSKKTWDSAQDIAEEILYNIKTIQSFANFEYELKRFYEKVEFCWNIDKKNSCKLGFSIGIMMPLLYLNLFIGIIYGRTLIKRHYNSYKGKDFSGGDVNPAILCTLLALMGLAIAFQSLKTIPQSCSAASDYFNLYGRNTEMDFSQSTKKIQSENFNSFIEFKNVKFYYPSDPYKRLILNGINLLFESGKKVALVGESGCGKSTIANLIERFYDICDGKLLIDGLEIEKYDIQYLRGMIGYVQQEPEPVLFNKSIRYNIIFGREKQLSSIGNIEQLIQKACDYANASEFINKLPGGLDYIINIKGDKLSRGQKQRIAIARAILTQPKILILDDPTSALDFKSEKEVLKLFDNMPQNNITIIIISNELSVIKNADLIYACKEGKVIEQGTYKELLDKGGYYSNLFLSQLDESEIEADNQKEENQKQKNSNIRINTDEEVNFEYKEKEISLKEEDIKFKISNIFMELGNFKLDISLACLATIILGCLSSFTGFIMANGMNALNSKYQTIRYDDGLKYALILIILACLQGIASSIMNWKFMSLGDTLARIYRKKLIKKYLSLHLSYFDIIENSPKLLLVKLSLDTMDLKTLFNSILGVLFQSSFVFIVGLIIGFCVEYRLTLINFCFIPFIILSNFLRRGIVQGWYNDDVKSKFETGLILSKCIINSKTIFAYNFQNSALEMYLDAIQYMLKTIYRDTFINGFLVAIGIFATFAAKAAIYSASKKFILDGSIDSENMIIVMMAVSSCTQDLGMNLANLGDLKQALINYRRIYSTLDTHSTISPYETDNRGRRSAKNIKGKIEFKNVYFAYPTNPENIILKDLSFVINPGEKVAIVGHAGSGKSTIIQLLNRFYDVEYHKGEILIDDVNIKNYNLYELRKKIGYISKYPSIFHASVLENIRYGRLDAKNEECIEAAKEMNILELLNKDKNNVTITKNEKDSYFGKKNDQLSIGEKQRLSFARTFLKNPTILLLDEVTSELDKDNELEIQKCLEKLNINRTSINITNSLSTIKGFDKILILANGRLIEQGTHDELMKFGGKYYKFHKSSDI